MIEARVDDSFPLDEQRWSEDRREAPRWLEALELHGSDTLAGVLAQAPAESYFILGQTPVKRAFALEWLSWRRRRDFEGLMRVQEAAARAAEAGARAAQWAAGAGIAAAVGCAFAAFAILVARH